MTRIQMPTTGINVHPEGDYSGTITEVQDKGIKETPYGPKPKVTIKIESDSVVDGKPFIVIHWLTVSSHEKSNLTRFRSSVIGRVLTSADLNNFDPDQELVGKQVGYRVIHRLTSGRTYANIDSIWPSVGQDAKNMNPADDDLPF